VVRRVETGVLILGRHTQDLHHPEREEDGAGGGAGPGTDREHTDELHAELRTAAAHEGSVVVLAGAVHAAGELLVGEEAGGDHAPHAAEEVHGGGVQGVVNLELEEELGGAVVNEGADEADEDGGPGIHDGAGAGDGDETSEDAVEGGGDVGGVLERDMDGEGGSTAGAGGEGGGDGGAGGVLHVLEREGGHGVETVPAEPQDEGTESGEDGGVAGHVLHLTGAGREAAGAGTKSDGAHERGAATSHVHDAGAGEVDQAVGAERELRPPRGEEAVRAPAPVHDDGVDEGSQGEGVAQVGGEGATLSDGTLGEREARRRRGMCDVSGWPRGLVRREDSRAK
jgi:hypothetical protein